MFYLTISVLLNHGFPNGRIFFRTISPIEYSQVDLSFILFIVIIMGCNTSKPAVVPAENQNTAPAPAPAKDNHVEQEVPVAVEQKPAETKPVEAEKKVEAQEKKVEAAPVAQEVKDEVVVVAEKPAQNKDHSIMFYDAHTAHGFEDKPVDEALLRKAIELAHLAPTAFSCSPMRVVFVKSAEAKEKLYPCLMEGNIPQTKEAPVVAIVCFDKKFYEKLPELCPVVPGLAENYAANPESAENTMTRNGLLQGGYFILALRSMGLDVGPMSGFNPAAVDAAFLANDEETKEWKSSFLINIGYANPAKNYPRAPRLAFDVATQFA